MTQRAVLFTILILTACLTHLSSDVYAPAMPAVATDLNVRVNLIQTSMAIFLLGVALTLLIYGPLSEGWGRKIPLVIGFVIMLAGTLVCLFAPSANILLLGRLVQGLGAGASAGLWRAIFRDIFTGEELSKYGAYFTLFITFIVPAAPLLGGFLHQTFGWRSIFTFLAGYTALILLLVIFCFKDTSKHHHPERLKLSFVSSQFKRLFTSKVFMGITFCTFLSYGAFFTWFVVAPVVMIHHVKLNSITFGGITFVMSAISYSLGGYLNGKLIKKLGMPNMLRLGWALMLTASATMLLLGITVGTTQFTLFAPSLLFMLGVTFIWPNAFATAMEPFGDIAGYAGALYSFMQMSGGALIGISASYLPDNSQIHLALTLISATALAWLLYEFQFGIRRSTA